MTKTTRNLLIFAGACISVPIILSLIIVVVLSTIQ
jgi:hypothetical protein